MSREQDNSRITPRLLGVAAFVASFTFIVFLPALQGEFLNYDDGVYMYGNEVVRKGLSLDAVSYAFTTIRGGSWMPVTWLSHLLDVSLYGLKPAGHHATSVLFHALNAALLLLLLHRLTARLWPALFVALVFAVHPLRNESVAWIAERKDVLCALFWFGGMHAYVSYVRSVNQRWLIATGALLALGLMSKPMMVTFPCALLLLDFWPLRRCGETWRAVRAHLPRLIKEKLPLFVLVAVLAGVTFWSQREVGAMEHHVAPVEVRLLAVPCNYVFYLEKAFVPKELTVLYPDQRPSTKAVVSSTAFLVAATILAGLNAWRFPWLIVGWLWFLGTLVPVIGIVRVGHILVADRYSYLPSVGLAIAIAWSIAQLVSRRKVLAIVSVFAGYGMALALALIAREDLARWQSSLTLFEAANRIAPHAIAFNSIAVYHLDRGEPGLAISPATRAIQLNPRYKNAFINRAIAREQTGDLEAARLDYARVDGSEPRSVEGYCNRAGQFLSQNRLAEAIRDYTYSLEFDPRCAGCYKSRADAHLLNRDFAAATQDCKRAIELKPDFGDAFLCFGNVMVAESNFSAALTAYDRAISLSPKDALAYNNRAAAYFRLGNITAARADIARCIELGGVPNAALVEALKQLAEAGIELSMEQAQSQPSGFGRREVGACLTIVLAVWLVFGQACGFGFVDYDDPDYVSANLRISKGITSAGVLAAFTQPHSGNWHPLTTLSHMLDCELFGLNASAHHAVNILLHAATALMLFMLCRRLRLPFWAGVWVALLFAVHPLRVESVVWVSERKDVLSGFFFVLTLWTYASYAASATGQLPSRLPLSVVVCFALGLMSKPMLVTVPIVLLLLDVWPLNRLPLASAAGCYSRLRPLLTEKLPLFVLAGGSCIATLWAQGRAVVPMDNLALDARVANALIAAATYLWQMLWPARLAVLYPYAGPDELLEKAFFSLILLGAISFAVWKWSAEKPFLLVGWLWFLGMLLPVAGIVQVGGQPHADRYTYLPLIGISLALAMLVSTADWSPRATVRSIVCVAGFGGVIALAWCARVETAHWRDTESLWSHTLANTRNNHMAHHNWGTSLLNAQRTDEAIEQFQRAVALQPNHLAAWNHLGRAYLARGNTTNAIACFNRVLQADPSNSRALLYLGRLTGRDTNDPVAGLHLLAQAVESDPRSGSARLALAQALIRAGRPAEALPHASEATKLMPDSADARYQLAVVLAAAGRPSEAEVQYLELLRRHPTHAEALRNLGNLMLLKGDLPVAIARYEESLRINPNQPTTRLYLGSAFAVSDQFERAAEQFAAAIQLAPDDPQAHKNLGLACVRLGRRDEAVRHLTEALRLKPDFAEARQALKELQP